ncbi:MAG: response regulator, partial [Oceanospirillaceae bacterium]
TFKQHKYHVFEANSGHQALDVLNNVHIDLIISDQRMPDMKGTQLLKIVKDRFPDTGRIMLSGHSDVEDLTAAINDASVNQFIAKPWNEEHLLAMAKQFSKKHPRSMIVEPQTSIQSRAKDTDRINLNTKKEALIKPQVILEAKIKNDALELKERPCFHQTNNKIFSYLDIWSDFLRYEHKNIVDIANDSGYLNDLFTWYMISISTFCKKNTNMSKIFVVDFFSHGFYYNDLTQRLVDDLLINNDDLIFRIPYDCLNKESFSLLLEKAHRNKISFLIDIGMDVIDVNLLESTPIIYLEMSGGSVTTYNGLLTENRLKMIGDAKALGISTILSGAEQKHQRDYASVMGFDIF